VTVGPPLAAGLETYFRLLAAWNQRINLSGLDLNDPTPEALDRLLIEPLLAARQISSSVHRMMDIGSGGGSPAIPMALAVPGVRLLMVESKTRKSVFLREAVRALQLPGAEVATARYEELLARPALHETHDLLTIRAVRMEARVLMSVQAFVKPGGQLFLFRGTVGSAGSEAATPPLVWRATFPLIESLRSRLVVLDKRDHRAGVPRGTPP
jgi:16S rRNA (guanine527-N7)-methyltransferase